MYDVSLYDCITILDDTCRKEKNKSKLLVKKCAPHSVLSCPRIEYSIYVRCIASPWGRFSTKLLKWGELCLRSHRKRWVLERNAAPGQSTRSHTNTLAKDCQSHTSVPGRKGGKHPHTPWKALGQVRPGYPLLRAGPQADPLVDGYPGDYREEEGGPRPPWSLPGPGQFHPSHGHVFAWTQPTP